MADRPGTITFSRPIPIGPGWKIEATWPRGHVEVITTFTTEAQADEWLVSSRCQAWLRARGYAK